jgi:hypothetical protein
MYVLHLSAVNLVSSLIKMYVPPAAVLELILLELLIEEAAEYVA